MKTFLLSVCIFFCGAFHAAHAQNVTYSEIEKSNYRNLSFEILGKFTDDFLVYKNINRRHELTIYDNNMAVKKSVNMNFVSDRAVNLDFITYPDYFLIFWQYEKGNVTRFRGAKMSAEGQLIGSVADLDTLKSSLFSARASFGLTWSEDRRKILLYRLTEKNDVFDINTKLFDENLVLIDTSKKILDYNDRREYFSDLQIDNEGTYIFSKVKHNARAEYINALELYAKRLRSDLLTSLNIPLDDRLIQNPFIKIDNLNKKYLINSFSYQKNSGNVDGIFTAVLNTIPVAVIKKTINVFDDSLRAKLSGRPDWRTAYDNFNLRNIILKKDGGFIVVSEEYFKQSRFGNGFDDRYSGNYNYRANDYFLYNRDNYGYYRPFNQGNTASTVYNYNDVISFSLTKELRMQWNNVINKTTSDIDNDNFLSFANMNAGGEIYFLFLQKDKNRQIISNHALQPDGSITRYATLKGREAGYNFMPRLARQTGLRQMIMPCIVRNNLAFAKIDF